MKTSVLLILLGVGAAWGQVNTNQVTGYMKNPVTLTGHPRIALGTFTDLERRFDSKLASLGGINDPVDMLGTTRGLYLDNYGAVFTTELSLVLAPAISPFRLTITPELKAQVHQKKIARLPQLKQAMREFLRSAAMTLAQIPADQQIVVAVRLDYMKWEDTLGLPGLVVMKADRQAAANDEIKVEEQ
jgi:hypothetical protein